MLTAFSKLEAPPLNAAPNGMDLLHRVEQIERVLLRLVNQVFCSASQPIPLPVRNTRVLVGQLTDSLAKA